MAERQLERAAPVTFGGEQLLLLPERAVWVPDRKALLVADVHLGKELEFRRHGIPIPDGATAADLSRLRVLCQSLGARSLWILGDLMHGRVNERLLCQLQDWCVAMSLIEIHLVEGNHDRHASAEFKRVPLRRCDVGTLGSVSLAHSAEHSSMSGFQMSGHLHPVTRIAVGRHRSLRVPTFVLQGQQLLLPAFGEFTGGLLIKPAKGQVHFPIIGDGLIRLEY